MTDTRNPLLDSMAADRMGRDEQRTRGLAPFIADADALLIASTSIPINNAQQLAVVLTAIGSHNNFVHDDAIASLSPYVERCDSVTVIHCADGPYITFSLPYWTNHAQAYRYYHQPASQKQPVDRVALAQELILRGKALIADSIKVRQSLTGTHDTRNVVLQGTPGEDPKEITFWWD